MKYLPLWALVVLTSAMPALSATVYQNDFTTASATNAAAYSWNLYHTAGTNISSLANPTDAPANPRRGGFFAPGYFFIQQSGTGTGGSAVALAGTDYFAFTNIYQSAPISQSLTGLTSLNASWAQSSTPASPTESVPTRLAVQLNNGNWYTTAAFSNTSGGYLTKNVSLLTDTWYLLNFTAGSALDLTSTSYAGLAAIGQTTITGYGFYIDNIPSSPSGDGGDYKTQRIDNFIVTAVPEPSRALLLLSGFLLFFGRRRQTFFSV